MPKNSFSVGEALTAEKMNTLLQEDRLVFGTHESGQNYSKIMTADAVSEKLDEVREKVYRITSSRNLIDSAEADGDKNKDEIIEIELPPADEETNNRYMAFLYYGVDAGGKQTNKGVQMLRAIMAYSERGSDVWQICDDEKHSWTLYCLTDTACGWVQSYVEENKLKIELHTYDDYDTTGQEKYFVQGWQLI